MGRATDLATLQFRMLNRSKGPAVWAPRAQCDRGLYRRAVRSLLEAQPRLETIQGTVARLLIAMANGVAGVETLEGRRFGARCVVVTTGTFLRGRIHIGTDDVDRRRTRRARPRRPISPSSSSARGSRWRASRPERRRASTAARCDCDALAATGERDRGLRLLLVALLAGRASPAGRHDAPPGAAPVLDHLPRAPTGRRIIARHIGESAMYGGAIASRGPRYCPSVEDKIVKFPDAERHQLFLEPEGHDTHELYVNGLSTSLPAPVQLAVAAHRSRARGRAHDARRVRDRVRLLSADAARRDAAGARACRDCSSPGRSTAPRDTRKRRDRGSSPAPTRPASRSGSAAARARPRELVHRRAGRRSRHARRRRAVSAVHVALGVPSHRCARTTRCGGSRPFGLALGPVRCAGARDGRRPTRGGGRGASPRRCDVDHAGAAGGRCSTAAGSTPLAHAVRVAELARRQSVSLLRSLPRRGRRGASSDRCRDQHGAGAQVRRLLRARADCRRTSCAAWESFRSIATLPYEEMLSLSFEARQKLARIDAHDARAGVEHAGRQSARICRIS